MTPPAKRLPGQSNADYENRTDPNAQFLGTQSIEGIGDPTWMYRALGAFLSWRDGRRERRSSR